MFGLPQIEKDITTMFRSSCMMTSGSGLMGISHEEC